MAACGGWAGARLPTDAAKFRFLVGLAVYPERLLENRRQLAHLERPWIAVNSLFANELTIRQQVP